jgi:uncharacterized Fe-S center protein
MPRLRRMSQGLPVRAVTIGGNGSKHAQIDRENCIRCYCCHEMCSEDAIELKASLLYRFLNG